MTKLRLKKAKCVKIFKKKSLTKQSHKKECDINERIKLFVKTGITSGNAQNPTYGDFDNEISYQQALNSVIEAQEQFDGLPSNIRKRFHNDPSNLIKFISNNQNKDEAIQLGLIDAPQIPPELPTQSEPTPQPNSKENQE